MSLDVCFALVFDVQVEVVKTCPDDEEEDDAEGDGGVAVNPGEMVESRVVVGVRFDCGSDSYSGDGRYGCGCGGRLAVVVSE